MIGQNSIDLRLFERPPGAYYGTAQVDDAVVGVHILPPAYLWAGRAPVDLDPTHWRVLADGRLLGRIEREEDVGPALLPLLAARTPEKPHSRSHYMEPPR